MLNKHNLVMIKRLFTKKTIFFLLLLPIVVAILTFSYKAPPQQNTNDKARADVLAETYQELEEQNIYKTIEIGKPTLLYDGTKITLYDIQLYEPAQVIRNRSDSAKYIAIALDIEIDKERNRVMRYNSYTKSITFYTDKETIDNSYAERIFDPRNNASNPHSMKWIMQELELELRLVFTDRTLTRLDPNFIRLAFDKESSQPSIFKLWRDYEKKTTDTTFIDAPRKIRGWVTWIFKIDESFITDKVDNTFAESLMVKYKNSGAYLNDLFEQLGKTK